MGSGSGHGDGCAGSCTGSAAGWEFPTEELFDEGPGPTGAVVPSGDGGSGTDAVVAEGNAVVGEGNGREFVVEPAEEFLLRVELWAVVVFLPEGELFDAPEPNRT